jgi:hypothetical protein
VCSRLAVLSLIGPASSGDTNQVYRAPLDTTTRTAGATSLRTISPKRGAPASVPSAGDPNAIPDTQTQVVELASADVGVERH